MDLQLSVFQTNVYRKSNQVTVFVHINKVFSKFSFHRDSFAPFMAFTYHKWSMVDQLLRADETNRSTRLTVLHDGLFRWTAIMRTEFRACARFVWQPREAGARMDKLDDQRLFLWQRASFVAGDTPRSVSESLRLKLNLIEYEILDKSRLVWLVESCVCRSQREVTRWCLRTGPVIGNCWPSQKSIFKNTDELWILMIKASVVFSSVCADRFLPN